MPVVLLPLLSLVLLQLVALQMLLMLLQFSYPPHPQTADAAARSCLSTSHSAHTDRLLRCTVFCQNCCWTAAPDPVPPPPTFLCQQVAIAAVGLPALVLSKHISFAEPAAAAAAAGVMHLPWLLLL